MNQNARSPENGSTQPKARLWQLPHIRSQLRTRRNNFGLICAHGATAGILRRTQGEPGRIVDDRSTYLSGSTPADAAPCEPPLTAASLRGRPWRERPGLLCAQGPGSGKISKCDVAREITIQLLNATRVWSREITGAAGCSPRISPGDGSSSDPSLQRDAFA